MAILEVDSNDGSMTTHAFDAGDGMFVFGDASRQFVEESNRSVELPTEKVTVAELVGEVAVHDALLVSADS